MYSECLNELAQTRVVAAEPSQLQDITNAQAIFTPVAVHECIKNHITHMRCVQKSLELDLFLSNMRSY